MTRKKLRMFPPGIEPGTSRVLGERDNHYTTETHCMPAPRQRVLLLCRNTFHVCDDVGRHAHMSIIVCVTNMRLSNPKCNMMCDYIIVYCVWTVWRTSKHHLEVPGILVLYLYALINKLPIMDALRR